MQQHPERRSPSINTDASPRRIPRVVGVAALALGLAAGGYGISSAATSSGSGTPSTPAATQSAPPANAQNGASPFRSNEDPAHEAGESAAREADEMAGHLAGGQFTPNEDATHEAGESAAREAEETALGTGGPATSVAPGQLGGTSNQEHTRIPLSSHVGPGHHNGHRVPSEH